MRGNSSIHEAVRLHQAGLFSEAESQYREILKSDPEQPDALHLLGVMSQQRGNSAEAVEYISKAINAKSDAAVFHANLGNALRDLKKFGLAEDSYERALELDPKFVTAMVNMSTLLLDHGRPHEALEWSEKAVALEGKNPFALAAQAGALRRLGRIKESLPVFEKALKINANDARAWSNYGNALRELNKYEEALSSQNRAVEIAPEYEEAWSNRGQILCTMGDFEGAIRSYDKAIELKPEFSEALWNKALVLLQMGKWEEGFQLYESRRNRPGAFQFPKPISEWMGEDLKGKSILVYAEQGLGDLIHFLRWVSVLADRGAQVTCSCQPAIHRLLQTFKLAPMKLVGFEYVTSDYDFQCSVMSLPAKLKLGGAAVRPLGAYLSAESESLQFWRAKMGDSKKLKVGIAWQGNPNYPDDHNRSLPLEALKHLFELEDVEFFSLQKGFGSEQIKALGFEAKIRDFTNEFDSGDDAFVDTAAMMTALDLVITPDTSTVHLAGALGRPTWLLSQKVPDWRSGISGEKSVWYESVRIYRQEKFFDWNSVVEKVYADLKVKAGAK